MSVQSLKESLKNASDEEIILLNLRLKEVEDEENRPPPELRGNNLAIQTPFPDIFGGQTEDIILSGPAGTGKSFAAFYYLHNTANNNPGIRILVMRKVRATLAETGLVTYEEKVLGSDHEMVINGPSRQGREKYQYKNGSIIVIGGLDKPGKVLSSEYDIIYVQQAEECDENDWETLKTRCRNYKLEYQRMLGDVNPGPPTHWIKSREERGKTILLPTFHKDNPMLWDGEDWTENGRAYIKTLQSLTGVRRQRLYKGLWAAAEGAIFEKWDTTRHIVPNFSDEMTERFRWIPKYRVIDFGYVRDHAFVCQWWAELPQGMHVKAEEFDIYGPILILYREIYVVGVTVPTAAKYINDLSMNDGEIKLTICDHNPGDVAILNANGITSTILATKKEIVTHFQRIEDAMVNDEFVIMEDCRIDPVTRQCSPDPELIREDLPRLPTCTAEEIPMLQWYKDRNDRINKQVPMPGQPDHGTKNIGYLLMTLKPQTGKLTAIQLIGW